MRESLDTCAEVLIRASCARGGVVDENICPAAEPLACIATIGVPRKRRRAGKSS